MKKYMHILSIILIFTLIFSSSSISFASEIEVFHVLEPSEEVLSESVFLISEEENLSLKAKDLEGGNACFELVQNGEIILITYTV